MIRFVIDSSIPRKSCANVRGNNMIVVLYVGRSRVFNYTILKIRWYSIEWFRLWFIFRIPVMGVLDFFE